MEREDEERVREEEDVRQSLRFFGIEKGGDIYREIKEGRKEGKERNAAIRIIKIHERWKHEDQRNMY